MTLAIVEPDNNFVSIVYIIETLYTPYIHPIYTLYKPYIDPIEFSLDQRLFYRATVAVALVSHLHKVVGTRYTLHPSLLLLVHHHHHLPYVHHHHQYYNQCHNLYSQHHTLSTSDYCVYFCNDKNKVVHSASSLRLLYSV